MIQQRVALLLEDYDFFVKDPDFFCRRLEALTELRGRAVVGEWIGLVRSGDTPTVVMDLLRQHYDPTYAASIERNFRHYSQAHVCCLKNRSAEAFSEAAASLLAAPGQGDP